jgi:hypothetical protein
VVLHGDILPYILKVRSGSVVLGGVVLGVWSFIGDIPPCVLKVRSGGPLSFHVGEIRGVVLRGVLHRGCPCILKVGLGVWSFIGNILPCILKVRIGGVVLHKGISR